MLVLKRLRNWSYDTLEQEVRANLVYRQFTRVGTERVPDAKSLIQIGQIRFNNRRMMTAGAS
jgi:IS5 family transposase